MPEPVRPFRWDLVRPDHLGTLLEGTPTPDVWYLDALVECAGKALARAGDRDLYFVGRSADSVFDLLSGALEHTSWRDRLHLLPLSAFGRRVTGEQLPQLRANLADAGITPAGLAAGRPTAFVDLVNGGGTYGNLFHVLRDWVDEERVSWDVVRRRLRFVGITWRKHTSPNALRWHQHAGWTAELPPSAVRNVALDWPVWDWFGNEQPKLTRGFPAPRWSDESVAQPRRDERTLAALAEAVAVVRAGRESRRELAAVLCGEPAVREPWLRNLVSRLRG